MCWVNKQYYVPFDQTVGKAGSRKSISYYRWVPIIILSQAMIFYITGVIWRLINGRIGFSLVAVVEGAMTCKKTLDTETRQKIIRYIVFQVDNYLMSSRSYKKGCCIDLKRVLAQYCCIVCGKFYGNYLTCSYLCIKLLYISNSIMQLMMLDYFLGYKKTYYFYGIHILLNMLKGEDWDSSDRFPRVTICDFNIRQHNNVQTYTLQCALPINLFNEKIFTFIWFLLFVLAITTFFNFIHWFRKIVFVRRQVNFVKRELRAMNVEHHELESAKKFTEHYLRRDGLLILRLISQNAGDIIGAEVLKGLWQSFAPDIRKRGGLNGIDEHMTHDMV